MSNNRTPSHRLTFSDAVEVWKRYIVHDFVQRIAADFDCNVGRIYQVVKGEIHPGSKEQAIAELEMSNPVAAAALREFIFKPKNPANDNQLDLFDQGEGS
ncbi:MAG TPA: hypothetical protein VID67_10380 [Rhizomicrobium sp.]|jgi:hypothetical protein